MLEYCYKNVGYRLKNTCNLQILHYQNGNWIEVFKVNFLEILDNESFRNEKTYQKSIPEFQRFW